MTAKAGSHKHELLRCASPERVRSRSAPYEWVSEDERFGVFGQK